MPAFEQGLGLENHVVADPLPGVAPADGMDHLREVFRCQAEPVGVEPDAALGGVVLPQLFEKAVENLLFARALPVVQLLDPGRHQLAYITVEHLQIALQNMVLETEVWLPELVAQRPVDG